MADSRCPGQNTQFWGPKDIFNIPCPECGETVEFFKDDAKRKCPSCSREVYNPRINTGCALWCPKAEDCLGPEQYESLTQSKQIAEQRKKDIDALISSVGKNDEDVKKLFKKLYIENTDMTCLIDTNKLESIKESDPRLFKKAVEYFSKFKKEN
ncbi:hypothetical protein HQ585_01050 [candidate division KSB1 bacterium]|nr:hypothetical protein [candidate division KSB1 bacterium]